MKLSDTLKCAVAAALAFTGTAALAGTDGFESGSFSGFTLQGQGSIVSSFAGFSAAEGQQFAVLSSDSGVSTTEYGGTTGAILSKTYNLAAGDKLSFKFAFNTNDYLPYNDFALFFGNQRADLGSAGTGNSPGWQTFEWTVGQQFSGEVVWVVSNQLDSAVPSRLLLDAVTVTPVPEPETYAMMLAGLVGLGFVARRKKAEKMG